MMKYFELIARLFEGTSMVIKKKLYKSFGDAPRFKVFVAN